MNDVAVLLRLLPRSATGQPISTYVSIMAGRRGADENDGPQDFHVVLVDNGRSKLIGTEAQDVLRCIRCSACINHCPIYGAIGGHAYGATYMGPIGAALNPFLEANGIVPVETDLGEYIVQLRKEPPSHIIAPAFHLSKEQVAESFFASHTELDPKRSLVERNALVQEARAVLRRHFEGADAGITGANFLSAKEGAAIIVTNEGNGDLTRLLPKTHIVVTGIEKVVADMNDVAVLLRLLPRSATGQPISTYVSIMAGKRGADENDGPQDFHVVLVDNGRSNLIGTEAQDVLRCIRCSACINHCPIYGAIGGHAYGATYMGPIGAALNPGVMGVENAAHHANASTFCGRCAEVCPVKIPLPKIMRHWRAVEYADGLAPRAIVTGLGVWAFAAKRPGLYRLGTKIMARLLRLMGRGGVVHGLPVMRGWFAVRDFPAPQGKTFLEQWAARK
ncbi:MAG: lactate utilization protein [Alphaproteobacteria bacterium]|nr:lactate utilization protein [Alphaproteobacteria bacterium]